MDHEIYRRAKEYLDYNPETGEFTWLKSPSANVKAGASAGGHDTAGYRRICLLGRNHSAHRLVFLLRDGRFPDGEVDHVNGDKTDNRLANLRVCSRSQNNQNVRARRDNRLGIKGVRVTKSGRFEAQVIARKCRLTATFDTPEQAADWLTTKREHLHGEFSRDS